MYRHVAQQPHDRFHFELGAPVALRAGYDADRLADVPAGAVESFAGVGYFFDLADLQTGESVVDLGSGSGMDAFYAAGLVGPTGHVYGVDFTQEQLDKARRIGRRRRTRTGRVPRGPHRGAPPRRCERRLRDLQRRDQPVPGQEGRVRRGGTGPQARRAPGDRRHHQRAAAHRRHRLQRRPVGLLHRRRRAAGALPPGDRVRRTSPSPTHRVNAYEFISDQARNASAKYGVKSISLLATKTTG